MSFYGRRGQRSHCMKNGNYDNATEVLTNYCKFMIFMAHEVTVAVKMHIMMG